jgi:hypothetical protein
MLEHTGIGPDSPDYQSHKCDHRPEKVVYPEIFVLFHLEQAKLRLKLTSSCKQYPLAGE